MRLGLAAALALAIIGVLALSVGEGFRPVSREPSPVVRLVPAGTAEPRSTPRPGAMCPALYHPVAPVGVRVSGDGRDMLDVAWARNDFYECAGNQRMSCGLPASEFLGWDVRWADDKGGEGIVEVRPEEGACSTLHTVLRDMDFGGGMPRHVVVQVRGVSRVGVSGWSEAAYWPAAGHAVLPVSTPTATPGPTPTPGGPTATPHPAGEEETVWLVAYDAGRGLPGRLIPTLPGTVSLTGWSPASGEYLEFRDVPHCAGSKQYWVVWPEAWGSPDRYELVSPSGGIAPVLERSWERVLAGVEIRGVDREYWRMSETWDCTRVAGQHLRVYGG